MNTEKILQYLNQCIDDRIFPGCAVGIVRRGETALVSAGRLTYETASPLVDENTLYDTASITKAIPTSCLALRLIEEGRLHLASRLIDFVPEFSGSFRGEILVRHLLTQTLDFDFRLSEKKDLAAADLLGAVLSAPLRTRPGSTFAYANATSILLGLVAERAAGKPLHEAAQETFFSPLGMHRTTFFPEAGRGDAIAPSEDDPWRGRVIRGEVHDESAWALRPAITAGSAGLFSTAADLLRFVTMIIAKGEWAGRRFFRPETIRLMHTNALPPDFGAKTGLGWELAQEAYMGKSCTASTFGKTGFTGCTVALDPARNAGMAFVTNHTYPRRRQDRAVINAVRCVLADFCLGG